MRVFYALDSLTSFLLDIPIQPTNHRRYVARRKCYNGVCFRRRE